MNLGRILSFSVLAFSLLTLAGCGEAGGAPTAKVSGVVMLDGAPLGKANVAFNPAPGNKARSANGSTDASGKFTLSCFKPNDGAMPGAYQVAITGDGVPAKYGTGAELKATVETGKPNDFKFELVKE